MSKTKTLTEDEIKAIKKGKKKIINELIKK